MREVPHTSDDSIFADCGRIETDSWDHFGELGDRRIMTTFMYHLEPAIGLNIWTIGDIR